MSPVDGHFYPFPKKLQEPYRRHCQDGSFDRLCLCLFYFSGPNESKTLITIIVNDHNSSVVVSFFPSPPVFFLPCHVACRILVPPPGMEPLPLAVEAWGLNHCTAKEFPIIVVVFVITLKSYIRPSLLFPFYASYSLTKAVTIKCLAVMEFLLWASLEMLHICYSYNPPAIVLFNCQVVSDSL